MAVAVEVGREVAVAHDDGVGELVVEFLKQCAQTGSLGLGARVVGLAVGVQTSFVADADGVSVVVLAVGTDLTEGTAVVDLTVAGDVIMIADIFPASAEVVGLALGETVVLGCFCGAAMQHNQCYCSHYGNS